MTETQESISKWTEETFGPAGSNARVVARANEEMAELLRAVTADVNDPKLPEECADVVIVLCRVATRLGGELRLSAEGVPAGMRPSRYAAAANLALAQAFDLIECDPNHTDAMVLLGDVVAYVVGLAARLGVDLHAEIDRKMAVNRARRWELDGSGCGYHVKGESQ